MKIGFVPLLADAGVPMLGLTFPAMLILLIPIILVETFLCRKWLNISVWESLGANGAANFASTVVGVPAAWLIMFFIEYWMGPVLSRFPSMHNVHSPIAHAVFFVLNAAWIVPGENGLWLIPAATLVLLVPFYFASYGVEYFIVHRILVKPERNELNPSSKQVRIAVRNANLVTYGVMFAGTAVWLLTVWPRHR